MLSITLPSLVATISPGVLALGLGIAVLPWLNPQATIARVAVVGLLIALMARYIWWRTCCTLPPAALSLEWGVGLFYLLVETLSVFAGMLSLIFLTRIRNRTAEADAHASWFSDRPAPPLIDVLICTYNEEQEIVERTIIGALSMDYPNFRTWVLDDGRRPWLELLCERLGCGYITRSDNAHAKAGNINHALKLLARHERRPDFISILDADFVPKAKFLERAISLFYDPGVGVVQTPQHFINPDPIQNNLTSARAAPDEQRFFFDIVMASKDAWSAAFCCGTSSLIRFDALIQIGGFPTDSVTEDYLLTLRLKEAGYRTVYLNEALSLGLAPEGIKEYITQRGRWCLGFMQIVRGRSGPLSGATKLDFTDRLSLIENFLNWSVVYVLRLVGLVIPMLYLLFDIKAVHADLSGMLNQFLPYFVWHTATMAWIAQGRVMPFIADVCQLISAPVILKAVATGLLRPRGHKFKVTAKGGDRSHRFVEWPLVRLYGGLFVMTMAAISYFFYLHENAATSQYSVMALVWSWYNVIILLITCCVCVELPRYRKSERFEANDMIEVVTPQDRRTYVLRDVSITGARIRGAAPVPIGADLIVMMADVPIGAKVVRQDSVSFGVDFDPSPQARIAMIRHFYRGNYVQAVARGDAVAVGRAVVARLFG